MATKQTIRFGELNSQLFKPPFLEIGSKTYSEYDQFNPRSIVNCKDNEYYGIDIEAGNNVDMICDFSKEGIVEKLHWENKYNTIHCHCVLEHVLDIFSFTKNIQDALNTSGILFITVPFAWKIHRIPVDMWRFTPQSIDYLFPRINFDPDQCAYSIRNNDQIFPIDGSAPEIHLGSKIMDAGFVLSTIIRVLRKCNLDNGYFKERALLFESNLMMIGKKCENKIYNYIE